jgi:hypothetical protein
MNLERLLVDGIELAARQTPPWKHGFEVMQQFIELEHVLLHCCLAA